MSIRLIKNLINYTILNLLIKFNFVVEMQMKNNFKGFISQAH